MFPPVANIMPRVSPPGGATILGQYVPGGTSIGIHHWSTYHSESNFKQAEEFHPERWMEGKDSEYASDNKKALQPFSYGPRNCIGKNMAYAESRLLLANVLWHFDLELMPESEDWLERTSTGVLWEKPPLVVQLTPRKTECML